MVYDSKKSGTAHEHLCLLIKQISLKVNSLVNQLSNSSWEFFMVSLNMSLGRLGAEASTDLKGWGCPTTIGSGPVTYPSSSPAGMARVLKKAMPGISYPRVTCKATKLG